MLHVRIVIALVLCATLAACAEAPPSDCATAEESENELWRVEQRAEACRREHSFSTTISPLFKRGIFDAKTPGFVFLAGLEGTGHHLWHTLFRSCKKLACGTSKDLSFGVAEGNPTHMKRKANGTAWHDLLYNAIKMSQQTTRMRSWPRTYLINIQDTSTFGMMSYPNYGGRRKETQLTDMVRLAEIMREAEGDLRIVIMLRHPHEIVSSDIRRMSLMDAVASRRVPIPRELSILADAYRMILVDMMILDIEYFLCTDYDNPMQNCELLQEHLKISKDEWDACNIIKTNYNVTHKPRYDGELAATIEELFMPTHRAILARCKLAHERAMARYHLAPRV
eukprot:m.16151 g.16151  ORF g.16151 m.16151 type:complete len:338 (-) comp3479_c1_seq1:294-1307(-)